MPSRSVPGSTIVRLVAPLVPAAERTRWIAEWTAELAHAHQGPRVPMQPLRLRARAFGCIPDAIWLRIHRGLGLSPIRAAWHDGKVTARLLARRPGYAALFVTTTAIGIGATTAIFSVADAVLLRPSPYPGAERLATVRAISRSGTYYASLPEDFAAQWATQAQLFDRVEAHHGRTVTMSGSAYPRHVTMAMTTPGYLSILGARAVLGRLFLPGDALPGAAPAAILSHEAWRRDFNGRPDIIGRAISIDGTTHVVTGVLDSRFVDPVERAVVWTPWEGPAAGRLPAGARTALLVRMRADLSRDALQQEFDAVARRWNSEQPRPRGAPWNVQPRYLDQVTASPETRRVVWLLGAAAVGLLLIVCANAANLLLVRGSSRALELATRQALGATRGRIARQLLVETFVLTLGGALGGLSLAMAGVAVLRDAIPSALSVYLISPVSIDARAVVFATALTLLVLLSAGLSPAIALSRLDAMPVGSGRSNSTTSRHSRLRRGIVMVQVGLSAMLVGGTVLLGKTMSELSQVDLGLETRNVLALELYLTAARYPQKERRDEFFDRLVDRVQRLNGVAGVTVASSIPPGAAFHFQTALQAEGSDPLAIQPSLLPDMSADSAFFSVLGIPIVAGRAFDSRDRMGSDPVAIIDERLARALWPSGAAVGRRFRVAEGSPWLTVVGVAGDVRARGPDDRGAPYELYTPAAQSGGGASYRTLALRTTVPPEQLVPAIREAVLAIDPTQPIEAIEPLDHRFASVLSQPRFLANLAGLFGGAALLLSTIGTFGVLSYAVSQRTREIGIRMALGARREAVMNGMLLEGLTLAAIGVGFGLAGMVGASQLLESLLFNVSARDPVMLGTAAGTVVLASLVATFIPARRASQVNPTIAMAAE